MKVFVCTTSLVLVLQGLVFSSSRAQASELSSTQPEIVCKEDVVYGRVLGAGLLADIAYPKSEKKIPAILSVHGGRWSRGTKKDNGAINVQQWAEMGFFAMTIDYRLRTCSPPPACYQDVQCAIRYIHAHAAEYNIDEDRIFLIGQSAGGHMVSLAATLGNNDFAKTGGWEDARDDFCASICVSGPHDLLTCPWGNLWTPQGVDSTVAREHASPIRHVSAQMRPLLIFHADNDKSVPIANALAMVEELKAKSAPHVFHHYETAGHMGITPEVITRSLEFINSVSDKAPAKSGAHAAPPSPVSSQK
ncbi:alpha/beta hydrolase fold domain-containing protein [Planctomicrobium sp. SH664]|uniref:alpha/beta hydrolase fold domain-containing protein n=1 Tax=Planctomicrobium sp. SH664 TaxID=3448125 RepID=UPI003F5C2B67